MFLLQSNHKVSAERMLHSRPQPDIGEGDSIGSNLVNKPLVLGLDPLIDVRALEIGKE